ncbi:InlB B-repeat-containing protein [Candidatus Saccharibacteria bacterium]|nr:InlB B-repeat-containing protein [Candidatus Saccharibacteria bacterium]MBQ3445360.1 InlB B-repeat-containing protein [Candidatus Saccharibacteria bacterium]
MNSVSYTLVYDANGGEGAPSSALKNGNENYAIFRADDGTPNRDGFVFLGWSLKPDGDAEIHGGDLFTVTSQNVTLYAVWAEGVTEEAVTAEADEENTEPLGVVVASKESAGTGVNSAIVGLGLLSVAIVAGVVVLLMIGRKSPRIISKEEM